MKIGRLYRVLFEDISVSAVQDFFEITGATGKMLLIRRIALGCTEQSPTNQQLKLRSRFMPATVTSGSGGAAATPAKTDPGDAAASFTAEVNNTTKATTNGTAITTGEWGVNIYAGLDEELARPVPIGPSEAWVFELIGAPTAAQKFSGFVEVEEIGG
jgi:hypothetical protein